MLEDKEREELHIDGLEEKNKQSLLNYLNCSRESNACLVWCSSEVPKIVKLHINSGGDEDMFGLWSLNVKVPAILTYTTSGEWHQWDIYNNNVLIGHGCVLEH
jgi:hypothetical protein